MPSLKKVIQTASRGADLSFVFRFLRLLTAKYTATNAYKLGIIDKKGKPLKKSSDLTTSEEKSSYTMLHRLTWKIRGLIEKIPLIGKSILLNYAAALFLLKEQKDPRIWTDEGYMKRKLMEFIETDWEANAQLLKEEVDNMEKKSFQFLRETAVETEASTYRDRMKDEKKKKKGPNKENKNEDIISKKIFKRFSNKEGVPDGMTLDKAGNLWVCQFHGACVSVLNKFAKQIHKINLPAKNITNCAFGGPKNSDLFVTSALKGMKNSEIKKFKFSGSLFKIQTNAIGINQKKFVIKNVKKRPLL